MNIKQGQMNQASAKSRLPDLAKQAISKWGQDKQLIHVVQELTELSLALQQYRYGKVTDVDVKTELADVYIMLQQVMLIFDVTNEELEELIDIKLDKLEQALSK